eukprot:7422976-Pyramimonas_sp.AAC.1
MQLHYTASRARDRGRRAFYKGYTALGPLGALGPSEDHAASTMHRRCISDAARYGARCSPR